MSLLYHGGSETQWLEWPRYYRSKKMVKAIL